MERHQRKGGIAAPASGFVSERIRDAIAVFFALKIRIPALKLEERMEPHKCSIVGILQGQN